MEKKKLNRLESLDVLRGFDLFCLVVLEMVLHPLAHAIDMPWFNSFMWGFSHVEWEGFSTWDLVMPLFLFMAGVSMPFSLSRYKDMPDKMAVYRRIGKRVRRIKLLRKLDVPLAEIREMLEGQRTLAEGMSQQLERLRSRRADLEEAIGFCTLLQQENGPLEQLDVEQTLARLTAKEEQGVSFVNIEQTDRKAERVRGALVGAGLFTALMLFIIGIMVWASCVDPEEAPPLPLLVVMFGIPAGCIVGTLKVLLDRIEEIGKGEEDAYRNY